MSVIITAFNRENFIAEAIESVLRSTLRAIEIIVVDDASTDATAAIAQSYSVADSRVVVHVNERNLGDYPNRNRAASYATGEFIKYVDSDDVIYPYGLQIMVDCMQTFPEAGFGLSTVPDKASPWPRLLSPAEAYREHFFQHDLLGRAPGSAIVRRDAFNTVGGFSGRRQVGDHELWLTLARKFALVKMPRDLVWDRMHAEQQKHYDTAIDKAIMHEEIQRNALNARDCPLSSTERREALARLYARRAWSYWALLRSGGGFHAAEEYRRRVGFPIHSIIGSAWRLTPHRAR